MKIGMGFVKFSFGQSEEEGKDAVLWRGKDMGYDKFGKQSGRIIVNQTEDKDLVRTQHWR